MSSFAAWGRIDELLVDLKKETDEEVFLKNENPSGITEGKLWDEGTFSVKFWEEKLSFNRSR